MLKFLGIIMSCLILSSPTWAQNQDLSLKWHGKIVSPECFVDLNPMEGNLPDAVPLKNCANKNMDKVSVEGSKYSLEHDEEQGAFRGYDVYVVNDKREENFLVMYFWSGGGTGVFSSGMEVTIDGDKLKVKNRFDGGDRCNGGLIGLGFGEDAKVISTKWVTPADLLYLAYKEDRGIGAYEDLEASAASCFAMVREKEGEFYNIELVDAVNDNNQEWTNNYTYQSCFNRVFEEQRKKKNNLNRDEFIKFMDHFFGECVPEKKE